MLVTKAPMLVAEKMNNFSLFVDFCSDNFKCKIKKHATFFILLVYFKK